HRLEHQQTTQQQRQRLMGKTGDRMQTTRLSCRDVSARLVRTPHRFLAHDDFLPLYLRYKFNGRSAASVSSDFTRRLPTLSLVELQLRVNRHPDMEN
ncbi:hypothetical protein, partial [Rhizobium leucaenae]|uniref:hypothetical protein n=1 Tax=Rhizobium leucaenae TaxID=29450 RepID=UPI001AECC4C1